MRKLKLYLGIILLFISGNLFSQDTKITVTNTIHVDSIIESPKGNLTLLTKKIRKAFIDYFIENQNIAKELEVPVMFIYNKDKGALEGTDPGRIEKRKFDAVKSIKVIYDPMKLGIYGTRALLGIIEIEFDEDKNKK